MLAVQELEKDLIVERLTDGLEKARALSKAVTQSGQIKVNGCKTILEKRPPTARSLKALRDAADKWNAGEFSCRALQKAVKDALNLKRLGNMTAQRMVQEVDIKFPRHKVKGQTSKGKAGRNKVTKFKAKAKACVHKPTRSTKQLKTYRAKR